MKRFIYFEGEWNENELDAKKMSQEKKYPKN